MCNYPLYESCQACPCGPYGQLPRGVIICHRLKNKTNFFSEITSPKSRLFSRQQCYVVNNINLDNHDPGFKMTTFQLPYTYNRKRKFMFFSDTMSSIPLCVVCINVQ